MNKLLPIKFFILILFSLTLFCCATPPDKPVTLRQFRALGLDRNFEFDYSREYLLKHLNEKGIVVFEARRRGPSQEPYYIKIMATSVGPVAETFPIE